MNKFLKIDVKDLKVGFYETSASPIGNCRSFWIMKLRRMPGKCRVPRGFGYLSCKQVSRQASTTNNA